MKAKHIVLDFLSLIFLLFLIGFSIIYFIVGNRIDMVIKVFKSLVPLSYFGLILLLKIRSTEDEVEKFEKEDNFNEIIVYLTLVDKIKDLIIITGIPFFILGLAFLGPEVDIADILQGVLTFFALLIWHLILFRIRDGLSKLTYITNFDKIIDGIIIFLLPIFIISFPLLIFQTVDFIDLVQAGLPFLLMYLWHKLLISPR